MTFFNLTVPLLINFSLLVTMTYLATRYRPMFISPESPLGERICYTLGFAGASCILTILGFATPEGIRFDLRQVPILLAGLNCGPMCGLITSLVAGGIRWWMGGAGALGELIGMVLNGLAAGFFQRWVHPKGEILQRPQLVLLGTISAILTAAPLLLFGPYPLNIMWAFRIFLPYLVGSIAGLTVVMWLLRDSALSYQAAARLRHQAQTDSLTGLANYRHLREFLATALALRLKNEKPLSFILVDIDHFKNYNDQFGHRAGDQILREIGLILQKGVRSTDLVARYGGEEFAIVLPHSSLEEALQTAERLRQMVESYPFLHQHLTISAGVTTYPDLAKTEAALMEQADRALYQAKAQGRNRVVSYQGP